MKPPSYSRINRYICVTPKLGTPFMRNTKSLDIGDMPQKSSVPGCSKLTTSLVNVSLKFQTLISQICQYFCWKNVRSFCSAKAFLIFSTKNITFFGYKVFKHLMSWSLNELVKLTMLWTTGPWTSTGLLNFVVYTWRIPISLLQIGSSPSWGPTPLV